MQQKIIAHRGYSARYLENTIDAFQAALDFEPAENIVGIELDIQASLDGEIIVLHDGNLERLCGSDLSVPKTTYAELAKAAQGTEKFQHQTIPLLQDVLTQVDHKKKVYCEIKVGNYDLDVLIQGLTALLNNYNLGGGVILHSFSCEVMQMLIDATKHLDVKYGFLFASDHMMNLPKVMEAIGQELDYLHPHFECLLDHTEQLCGYGKKFNVWTVNTVSDMQKLVDIKHADMIEAFISDEISLAKWNPDVESQSSGAR